MALRATGGGSTMSFFIGSIPAKSVTAYGAARHVEDRPHIRPAIELEIAFGPMDRKHYFTAMTTLPFARPVWI